MIFIVCIAQRSGKALAFDEVLMAGKSKKRPVSLDVFRRNTVRTDVWPHVYDSRGEGEETGVGREARSREEWKPNNEGWFCDAALQRQR